MWQVLGVDFSPNGYHLATGGEDHTCRIWDLRKKGCLYVIPAHTSLVSALKWEPRDGHFLVTASYDNTARVGYGLRVNGYGLRVTGYGLRVTGYGLRATGHGSQVTGPGLWVMG